MTQNPGTAGAERDPDRQFTPAGLAAREEQRGDVGARNQQHEADRREEHHERGPDAADHVRLQRNEIEAPRAGAVIGGVGVRQGSANRGELTAGRAEGHAPADSSDGMEIPHVARAPEEMRL